MTLWIQYFSAFCSKYCIYTKFSGITDEIINWNSCARRSGNIKNLGAIFLDRSNYTLNNFSIRMLELIGIFTVLGKLHNLVKQGWSIRKFQPCKSIINKSYQLSWLLLWWNREFLKLSKSQASIKSFKFFWIIFWIINRNFLKFFGIWCTIRTQILRKWLIISEVNNW